MLPYQSWRQFTNLGQIFQIENPLFEGLCYNHKGFELFSKANFESSWAFEGLKICKIIYVMSPFWSLAPFLFMKATCIFEFSKEHNRAYQNFQRIFFMTFRYQNSLYLATHFMLILLFRLLE